MVMGTIREYRFDNDSHVYEGECLHGERNGHGKEYNYGGRLIFEGEYLNGKRNSFGKEYEYEDLIFEGEYLDGKKWNGKAKEYNSRNRDEIIFDGEYLKGEKSNRIAIE